MTQPYTYLGKQVLGPDGFHFADACDPKSAALITDALNTKAGRGWQPIETAPRDGAQIILGRAGRVLTGKYYAEGGTPGFYSGDVGSNDIDPSKRPATHWMPLPSPPESEGAVA